MTLEKLAITNRYLPNHFIFLHSIWKWLRACFAPQHTSLFRSWQFPASPRRQFHLPKQQTLKAFVENSTEIVPRICPFLPHYVINAKQEFFHPWIILFTLTQMGSFSAMLCHSWNAKGTTGVNLSLLPTANIMCHTWRTGCLCRKTEDAPEASKLCTRTQLPSSAVNFLY